MSMIEKANAQSVIGARLIARNHLVESCGAQGRFIAELFDRDGRLKWRDEFPNTVMVVGKNLMLGTAFAGSAYTVTGPFMGLISSASFTGIDTADTMASHAGWLEAGSAHAPTYSGTRDTAVFAAASAGAISLTAPLTFSFTGVGTVKGGFICYGTGAVNTIGSTAGTLWSAGLFATGDRLVQIGDALNITYAASL